MWTRSDVLALLQLLAMIIFAIIQAVWCLTIRQGARLVLVQESMLTALKWPCDVARMVLPVVMGMKVEAKCSHSRSYEHRQSHCHCHRHANDRLPERCAYIHFRQRYQTRDSYLMYHCSPTTAAACVTNVRTGEETRGRDVMLLNCTFTTLRSSFLACPSTGAIRGTHHHAKRP